jgi:DNA-binding MarR family transcriptional regulator
MYGTTGHLLRRAHQQANALFFAACDELTGVQFAALTAIADQPGVDATRLSALIAFDRSTIGGVIDRLEQKGLVSRAAYVKDRRVKLLYATPKGSALLAQVDARAWGVSNRLLASLPEADRQRFVRMLRTLIDASDASDAGAAAAARTTRAARAPARRKAQAPRSP